MQPKLSAAVRRALARGRDFTLRVTVTFTPKGAKKSQKVTKKITLHG
jgi:hypothetical protein